MALRLLTPPANVRQGWVRGAGDPEGLLGVPAPPCFSGALSLGAEERPSRISQRADPAALGAVCRRSGSRRARGAGAEVSELHLSRAPHPPVAPQIQGWEPQGQEPLRGAGVLGIPNTSPVPAAPACPGVKGHALTEPLRQSLRTGPLWGPAAPARLVLFAPLGGEALIPGPPHTPRSRASPAGFVSLAVWGRQRYRELERSRGVGGWAIRSLRPFSSWRLSSGAWGCSRPGCCSGRGGEGPEDGRRAAAGETTVGTREPGSQHAQTAHHPPLRRPALPRRNSKSGSRRTPGVPGGGCGFVCGSGCREKTEPLGYFLLNGDAGLGGCFLRLSLPYLLERSHPLHPRPGQGCPPLLAGG